MQLKKGVHEAACAPAYVHASTANNTHSGVEIANTNGLFKRFDSQRRGLNS